MPHAFVEISCSCNMKKKYHCFSHDDNGCFDDFNCHHFKCSALKRAKFGWLLGFDQLAGLYFDITCLTCGKKEKYSYEAKTFGKKNNDYNFNCCHNDLTFHSTFAH